jgi:hypothetical protein
MEGPENSIHGIKIFRIIFEVDKADFNGSEIFEGFRHKIMQNLTVLVDEFPRLFSRVVFRTFSGPFGGRACVFAAFPGSGRERKIDAISSSIFRPEKARASSPSAGRWRPPEP